MTKEVLVLGAGPSGMAAAFELYRAGKSFMVIEKNDQVFLSLKLSPLSMLRYTQNSQFSVKSTLKIEL